MANTTGLVLPTGLIVRRQGDCLEEFTSKAGEGQLLFARDNVELHTVMLHKNRRVTLVPSKDTSEVYFVLTGKLRSDLPTGPISVGSGDYIITENLEEPAIFTALSKVHFIYVTTRPTFHTVSQYHNELVKLAVDIEVTDGYTAEHCNRLQIWSYHIGKVLGLSHERLRLLSYAAYLHDVGKIKVPLEILLKPGPLTDKEWSVMQQHPRFGRELLEASNLEGAGHIVEQHHERLDGSGYPKGLADDEILLEAYIVAVADAYDSMTTDRPYRKAMAHEDALREIQRNIGVYYPSHVVKAFLKVIANHQK